MQRQQTIPASANAVFQTLFESVPGLYLVLLPNLTIYAVNDAYAAATFTNRQVITGKYLFDVFPDNPEDKNADGVSNLQASLQYVLKHKAPHTMSVQKYDIRRPDGSFEVRYWSAHNKPVLDENNDVQFIIHRVADVTEFKTLQLEQTAKDKLNAQLLLQFQEMEVEVLQRSQELQKLNEELERKVLERTALLESVHKDVSDYKFALDVSSIVAVTDQKGIIQHVNDNFCKISKYTKEELIGQDHRIVNSGYHAKEFIRNLWVTIANGKIWKGELKNKAKDGTVYWVDTTIVPFVNDEGKPYKYLAIRADITQRKKAEENILKLNEDLENKVQERTLELTHSLEHQQAVNEMKSRFVSMASHEFRTPLTAILSSISLIGSYKNEDVGEKRDKHISRIRSSVKNLTSILDNFLSLDKLEQGKIEPSTESFDLCDFAADIIEEVNNMLKEGQRIIFSNRGENVIVQDKKILRNVLLNLLSNAIKYSGENKKIAFSVDVSNNLVTITIKDEGIGIPMEEQAHLFEKFFRANNVSTIQGTGLGLSIVKKYMELLDGTISFKSIPAKGTTFTISFPQNITA